MVAHFLAREDEQDRFVSVLCRALDEANDPDEGFLIVVQGHGGIGKSELLNRFADIVRGKVRRRELTDDFYLVSVDWSVERNNRPADYASWAGPPIWIAFDALYVSLRDEVTGRRARRRFDRAFSDYRSQATKLITSRPVESEPSRLPDILGAAVGMIGGLAPVPGADSVSGNAAKLTTEVTQSAQKARARVDDRVYDTLIGPDDALVRTFASGLREVSRIRPIVLILDTAEILGEARRRIRQVVKRSGAKTVWVWGIRLEEEANAAEDSETMLLRRRIDNARLRLVPLSRFDDKTVMLYLQERVSGIPITAELTRDVVALTRGIPLAVHLATTLLSNGIPPTAALREVSATGETSEVISGLARRYLIHLTQTQNGEMRADLPLIYGLALMDGRTSDPDLLAALWDVPASEVAQRLDELVSRHDFVLSGQRRMHQEIQKTIQLFLLDPVRRPEVRAANQRAMKTLRDRMNSLSGITTVEAQLADEDWCAAVRQLLWHTFWVNVRDGLRLLAEVIPAAHTLSQALTTDLLRTAEWFEPIFTAEQRAVYTGIRALLPSGPFMNRLQTEFRRAAERLERPPVIRSAMGVITAAADEPQSVLAPDVPLTVFVLLLRLDAAGDDIDAEKVTALEQMAELFPTSGAQHLRTIITSRVEELTQNIVNNQGAQDVAMGISRAAVQFAPGNPTLHVLSARACKAAGELNLALGAIEEACSLQPGNAEAHTWRGLILRDLNRYEDALAAYEEACRLEPNNPQWHGNRGIALDRLNRREDTLAAFAEACRLEPDNPQWHSNRGIVLRHLNRLEDALAAYEEACRLEPDNPQWHGNRGIALDRLNRREDALAAFAEACRLEPDNPQWRIYWGNELSHLERYEDALAAYEEACRLEPDNPQWHSNRGIVLRDLNRLEDALAAYEEACRLEPDNPQRHLIRGLALARLNRYEEALAAQDEVLRLAPDNKTALNNRGESLIMLERDDEAMSSLRRCVELSSDDCLEASILLALLLQRNEMAKARELCKEALRMPDADNYTQCRRAELRALAHSILGNSDEAELELRTAVAAWTSADLYQPRLYELLNATMREGAERLLSIWYDHWMAQPGCGGETLR